MQRDVEFEIESADKSGGFIGALWLKGENAAISLAREGYAFVHAFSAEGLSWAKQIYDAEVCTIVSFYQLTLTHERQAEAKQARRHVSSNLHTQSHTLIEALVGVAKLRRGGRESCAGTRGGRFCIIEARVHGCHHQ